MKKWECTVCGYVHEGEEPPDECPVCSADKSLFVEITNTESAEEQAVAEAPQPVGTNTALARLYRLASELINRYHLHPIAVHTPNGIVPMAFVFLLITAVFGFPLFETAALYSLVFVFINMPLVLFTGYEMWQQRYQGALTSLFKIKLAASAVTLLALLILISWRLAVPDIVSTPSPGRWLYLAIALLLLLAVGTAGHMGGKLVFGTRKH